MLLSRAQQHGPGRTCLLHSHTWLSVPFGGFRKPTVLPPVMWQRCPRVLVVGVYGCFWEEGISQDLSSMHPAYFVLLLIAHFSGCFEGFQVFKHFLSVWFSLATFSISACLVVCYYIGSCTYGGSFLGLGEGMKETRLVRLLGQVYTNEVTHWKKLMF